MTIKNWLSAGLLLAASSTVPAWAIDGVALEIGNGDHVDRVEGALQWDWNRQLLRFSDWHLGGYWDLSLGQWHRGSVSAGQNKDITDVGFTPVFRVQPNGLTGPYAEAGIGLHLLSHASIGEKNLSTSFQFGDHLGLGYRFGAKGAFDVGYRFQHFSNGGVKRPNPGINFNQVRLQYHF
ncbi:MAG: acyloxyacyl hydrolase [Burkholderiales bacterium]